MGVFLRHLSKAGRQLGSAVNAYNEAVGSAESRVLPQMRRFQELGAAAGEEAESPKPIDQAVRPVVADELREIEAAGDPEGPAVELPARAESDAA